ncbi:cryptochrome/photolyase family protein [Prauserella muralis]|uniref:Uncharacterized protein n=1 Tax=Prauserella muralis TaxID=588067 RepID=A0A2V4AHV0_9PSEU|nr:deoxyribodipyrimidine photo-lyase [Prauserella muralis]PXY19495.1 hypothetical protein BAY60_32670 [Prauserella muralis]TWE29473.1 deoxyribodipyrimidine photo-lyase [Prauserella muralis]
MTVAIALFTRDLRVHDNPVLHAAVSSAERVVPLFVLDEAITGGRFNRPNRAVFLAACLRDLDRGLRERGGRLVVRRGRTADEVARLADEHDVTAVHVAADVSGFARRREETLRERLAAAGRDLCVHDTSVTVVPPGAVTPSGNDHFAVYTPYYRQWSAAAKRAVLPAPRRLSLPNVAEGSLPAREEICPGPTSPDLPEGGERAGRALLDAWVDGPVRDYGSAHDDLAADGTSRLSPHLHFGTVSPTELVHRARESAEFVRQVAWRDFHHQVLAARPSAATRDYRPHGDRWRRSAIDLRAWQEGRTGYPIVDAGMRQLRREGWLHNRVLNPLLQAKRYDPDGAYVRRYVPELAKIPGAAVHEPWKLPPAMLDDLGYPRPIVDLREGSERFLTARGKR